MVVQFVVFDHRGDAMTIDTAENVKQMQQMSVLQLKEKIAAKYPAGSKGVSMSNVTLVFGSKRLDADFKLLSEYGVTHKSRLQMVMTLDGGMAV